MSGNFRDELGKAFIAAGEQFPELVVVTADVSKSTRSIEFKKRWPERFYSVGIAEADAVSIAAGIASFGHPVIWTAYGVFATEKPFEQIRNTICYPEMNVKIVATHGGISVGEDGATHQAIEDIAIMRALPNMRVIVAADPGEVKAAVFEAIRTPGPVYVRLGRSVGGYVHPNPDAVELKLGQAETLRDGTDVTLVGVGVMVEQSLIAAEKLQEKGISARVINLRTVGCRSVVIWMPRSRKRCSSSLARCSYISGNSMPVSADSTILMGISRSIIKSSMAVLSLPPDRLTA